MNGEIVCKRMVNHSILAIVYCQRLEWFEIWRFPTFEEHSNKNYVGNVKYPTETDLEGKMQTIEDLLRANGAFFLSKNANFLQYLSFFIKRFILNNSIPTFCFGVLRESLCFDLLWCMSYFSNECLTFVNNQNSCSSANFACLFLFSSQSHKHLLLPFYSTHHWWFIQSGVHLVFVM